MISVHTCNTIHSVRVVGASFEFVVYLRGNVTSRSISWMNKPDFCHHPTSERCNPKSVRFILSSCRRYSLKEPSRFEAIADLHFGGVSNDARLQSIGNSRFPDHRITGPSGFSDFLPLPPASGSILSWLMVILHRSRLLVGALTV